MKNVNLKYTIWLLIIGLSSALYGQDRLLKGRVVDDQTGEGLPGAAILIRGLGSGTVTDMEGNFSLQLPEEGGTLEVSYIGFVSQQILVMNQTDIEVKMSIDITALEEVVVIGYGSVKKSDATGSLAVVGAKDFNRGAVNSPQELIAGKIPGVAITSNSGAPGNTSTIRIRGGTSISASNDPLIVVDGVPLDNRALGGSPNNLAFLNPNDIESFTVLKDASATAIYGSRAANGVILITTKRGAAGFKVSYNATASVYTVPKTVDVYTGDEFRALVNDVYGDNPAITSLLGTSNTDWQKEIYQTAFGQDHNLGFSGSIKKVPYRVSLGYNNTDGILKTYNFERTTASVGFDPSFFHDKLKVRVNLKGMNNQNNFADQSAIGDAIAYDPTKPVFDGNSRWRGYTTWTLPGTGVDGTGINLAPGNPVARLALTDNTSTVRRSIGNIHMDYELPVLKGLHANLNLGYDYTNIEGHNNVKDSAQWIYSLATGDGRINPYKDSRRNELLDFYLNYTKELPGIDSKLEAMGGYSWSHFWRSNEDSITTAAGETVKPPFDFKSEHYLLSFFGRLNYTLKDRYLFTATLRNDASSRFNPDLRWGLFPSAAFAWHVANEGFLTNSNVVSDLKLRLGYGQIGQQDVGGSDYAYIYQFTISDNAARYRLGNDLINTLRPEGYDENLRWEVTTSYNVGIDFGFLENRLTGTMDLYLKQTDDLLSRVDVAAGTNYSSSVLTNVGSMENRGVELSLNAKVIDKKDLSLEVGYNFFYNRNEITKLNLNDDADYIIQEGGIGGTTSGTIRALKVGYPYQSFYVLEQVYGSNGAPIEDAFIDRNGDEVINSGDYYFYKKAPADVLMGINSRVTYKNWDFAFVGRASLGNYVYNNVASNSTYQQLYSSLEFLRNGSTLADKTQFKTALNTRFSDYYIEDASFFRLDNINLGYRFDGLAGNRLDLRTSVGVQNVLVITKYSGLDPEISGGLDNNFFPRTRVFLLGVNAEF